jgi:uncharacterized phage protein (TIGR02218 family)
MSAQSDFQAHLASGSTTLARAWWVQRRDGVGYGFTDHDQDLTFEGRHFKASAGLTARVLQQSTGLSVDNTEAVGALSDAAIDEADLQAGRFDGAEVTIWAVNWADVAQRAVLFMGSFGEITRAGGAFRAELRARAEALNALQGRVYQRGCSAALGDRACGVDLGQAGLRAVMQVAQILPSGEIALTGAGGQEAGFFQLGRALVQTGLAAGLSAMIKHDLPQPHGGRHIKLWQNLPAPLALGDSITLEAGCDRTVQTCARKFGNLVNFAYLYYVNKLRL